MTGWLVLSFVVAFLLVIPAAAQRVLRRRMLRMVCAHCGRTTSDLPTFCYAGAGDYTHHGEKGWKPVGEVRARNNGDAAAALGIALLWPLILVGVLLRGAGRLCWRGASAVALKAPLTEPEQRRVLAEQAARIEANNREIARLTREIERSS